MADYPAREPYFAHRFIRLLTKTAAAQELGPGLCWLLTVVAMQEDSKRYTEPAKWYLGQLLPISGFKSCQSLVSAIKRAQAEGWLDYQPGSKVYPGKFSVKIPSRFLGLPDTPCDESGCEAFIPKTGSNVDGFIPKTGTQSEDSFQNLERKRNESGMNPERKPCASIPIPNPIPNAPHKQKQKRFIPPTLAEIQEYCQSRKNDVNAQRLLDFYTANGWVQGKGKPIRDWKAAVRTWEHNAQSMSKTSRDDVPLWPTSNQQVKL